MTEADWLSGDDPEKLYLALRDEKCSFRTRWQGWMSVRRFPVSDRKFRLYYCAVCQRVVDLLPQETRGLLVVAERWAEGRAREEEMREATETARRVFAAFLAPRPGPELSANELATIAVTGIFLNDGEETLRMARAARPMAFGAEKRLLERDNAERDHVELLHDIVGNPFRTAHVDPSWQAWNGRIVPALAQSIYNDRAFDRLPILADALEDAGCADEDVLGHLRGDGAHVPGCWVLDALLGKS